MTSSLERTLDDISYANQILQDITQRLDLQVHALQNGGEQTWVILIMVFILSCFIGYFVVWNVTPALHAPLMSVTNAISSVIIVGGILAVAADPPWMWVGLLAIVIASINIVGGFLVSHRMLSMFKSKKKSS